MSEIIKHSLDLAISLIDSTTGRHVGDPSIEFIFDNVMIPRPVPRGSGTYILMGFGRENFHMQIKLRGYETADVYVDYEKLDERLPLQNVFLIPAISPMLNNDVISLKGTIPNLTEISLIRMVDVIAHTDAYDAKKKTLIVFEKGNRLNMEGSPFGIISSTLESFEAIDIANQIDSNKVMLKDPLDGEFVRNASIARIIHGTVDRSGNYNIAVRDSGADLRCIVKYVINEETKFMKIDFHHLDEIEMLQKGD